MHAEPRGTAIQALIDTIAPSPGRTKDEEVILLLTTSRLLRHFKRSKKRAAMLPSIIWNAERCKEARLLLGFDRSKTARNGKPTALYLDVRFARASTLVKHCADNKNRTATIGFTLLRRPLSALALWSIWKDIPFYKVKTPEHGQAEFQDILRATSSLPLLGNEPLAVLTIPHDMNQYLIGRRMQALRTNQRRAIDLGCVVEIVPTGDTRTRTNAELRPFLSEEAHLSIAEWPIGSTPDRIGIVGRDALGAPLVVAVARCFGRFAILEMFLRLSDSIHASACRSLVHVALIKQLHAADVRHLSAGGAFRLDSNLQYLQYLQGFEPTHIVLLENE